MKTLEQEREAEDNTVMEGGRRLGPWAKAAIAFQVGGTSYVDMGAVQREEAGLARIIGG